MQPQAFGEARGQVVRVVPSGAVEFRGLSCRTIRFFGICWNVPCFDAGDVFFLHAASVAYWLTG